MLAIVENIRGSAGLRMGHVSSLLKNGMTRDKSASMVDCILELVDPVDRESAFCRLQWLGRALWVRLTKESNL